MFLSENYFVQVIEQSDKQFLGSRFFDFFFHFGHCQGRFRECFQNLALKMPKISIFYIKKKVRSNENDESLKNGLIKMKDRVEKFSKPQLISALHSFGSSSTSSAKVRATACLKWAKRGKIRVQPGAVQRRKVIEFSYRLKFQIYF